MRRETTSPGGLLLGRPRRAGEQQAAGHAGATFVQRRRCAGWLRGRMLIGDDCAMTTVQRRPFLSRIRKARLPALIAIVGLLDVPAHAQRIENAMAVFAALDKVTAAVKQVAVGLNQTGEF